MLLIATFQPRWGAQHRDSKMTYSTIQDAAAALFAAFVSAKRDNGDTFYKLADGSPEWMTDAIHAAHGDMMPDDWRYSFIRSVAAALSEDADDLDDARHEAVDAIVDVYNARLAAWLGSHGARLNYCDEAFNECGARAGTFNVTVAILQMGQYREIDEVWGLLVAALEGEVSE